MSFARYAAPFAFAAAYALPAFAGDGVVSAYRTYVDGLQHGDAAMAASAYAPRTRIIAGPLCTFEAPCTTTDAVRATMDQWAQWGLKDRSLDAAPQVLGENLLFDRIEVTWTGIEDEGITRIVGINFVEAKDGLIVQKIFIPDPNDGQTKKWLATLSQ